VTPRYDIGRDPDPISTEVLSLLADCQTATIGHWRQWGFCDRRIQALSPGVRVVGRAITVALPGPCSTLLHYAVDVLKPRDILLVDRLGDDRYACWGDGMSLAVKAADGVAGVVDGPCTDAADIRKVGLPVWCRGAAPITTRQYDLGGRLNRPVCIGGVVVNPGDVVLCDESGVLVLPPEEAEAEARRALNIQGNEVQLQSRIVKGEKLSALFGARARVEAALRERSP
jgi:4-hydroxy-4-methyl-2-oxoglutarate aldolase